MNSLLTVINFIPGIFILFFMIKTIADAIKNDSYYFVSYHWSSENKSGYSSIEISLHGLHIESYDDIQEIKAYIEEVNKEKITVTILNYIKLSKKGKAVKNQNIVFTDNGIIVNSEH